MNVDEKEKCLIKKRYEALKRKIERQQKELKKK